MSQFSTTDPSRYAAVYKDKEDNKTYKLPLVALELVDGDLVGYVLDSGDDDARFSRADAFTNFQGYAEADEEDHVEPVIVPATQGWWAVWRQGDGTSGARQSIIGWLIEEGGFGVQAIVTPDSDGDVRPIDLGHEDCEFRYEPRPADA